MDVPFLLQQAVNAVSLGAIYALIAIGYTMVYGVLRLINFAHGDVYMMGAFAGYYIARATGTGHEPSMAHAALVLGLSMAVCAALGMLIERFAYRPARRHSKLTLLIIAMGVSMLLENFASVVFGAEPKLFPQLIRSRALEMGGVTVSSSRLIILVVGVALMLLLHWIVTRTRTGKAMRAASFNLDAAKLMGIDTDRVIALTFALGSAFAAAAGVLVSLSIPKIEPLMGIMPGLKAFVAAVLGGIGSIPGALLGGFLIGGAEVAVGASRWSTYRDAIAFVILILILLFRPTGLLGKAVKEKV